MKNKYVTLHLTFAFLAILIAFLLPSDLFLRIKDGTSLDLVLAQQHAFHIVKYGFLLVAFHHIFQAAKIHLDEKENQAKE